MVLIVLLILFLVILFYIKMVRTYSYWSKKGVKQRKQIYVFGDNAAIMFRRITNFDALINRYNAFPEERYIGIYQLTLPMLLIKDLELIKQIAVKEFDHFVDHRQFIPEDIDPIWSRNLFALKGEQWRRMRTTLSPTFTSSKMKTIFNLISECANNYVHFFKKVEDVEPIELKDMFTRYANDVIATAAFGIQCDSINDKTNEFYLKGKDVNTFTLWKSMGFLFHAILPELSKLIGIKLFAQAVTDFFKNLVINTIKIREEQNIVRRDMIHLLLEAKKGKIKTEEQSIVGIDTGFATVKETIKENPSKKFEITDMDIAAQALLFFFGGFESVSTTMCFMGYELTINPDIQKRLQEEIDETLRNCDGKLTYEALMKMKYMDAVVSETLRKWPTNPGTDRMCTKSFTIEPVAPNEKSLTLVPGDIVWIPINGLHRDPKYYPNPEKFDPERFSDENRGNIEPYAYLPFGLGPRNCIGSRFALMEVKTIFFYLFQNFDFVVVERTDIPLRLSKKSFSMLPDNGTWVGLKRREV